jgi:predicted metal-dependent peptidase
MERVVGEILQPKVDWRDVLQRFLVKCRTDNRSFARFNRRFLPQGLFLPSVSGEVMGEILVAVDCSGSIDAKTIAQFAGEIQAIKDDMTPTKVHVVYFDSEVSHYEVYEHDDSLDIKPHGGGGTDFAPVFDYMVEHGIEPVAVVFLTDLCCNSFGIPPDCPVLWVSTEQDMSAPFGEIVEMN